MSKMSVYSWEINKARIITYRYYLMDDVQSNLITTA
jgi:hypothetical protein